MIVTIVCVTLFAAIFGTIAVASGRVLARRYNLVDRPDGRRKLQAHPVAVCGGVGVLVGAICGLLAAMAIVPDVRTALTAHPEKSLALLAAAVVIAVVGLIDDLITLRARHKLLGQVAAALILIGPGGYLIPQISLFGQHVELGIAAIPLTLFWFLAAINAINLLDGMDGLLGTVSLIIFGSLAGMALGLGNDFTGYIALAMVGAILGFLVFNLPPASVYLGDCGSMLIGLVVAALAISASLKGTALAIIGPAALLVLPILDTSAAIVRRKLTGRALAVADRGHFHHHLQHRFASRWWVLAVAGVIGGVGSAGALCGTFLSNDLYAVAAAFAVVAVLVLTGWFGLAEMRLIRSRATATYQTVRGNRNSVEMSVQLQGSAEWKDLWGRLVTLSKALQVHSLHLDVNAPAWHESFHARWDRSDSGVFSLAVHFWRVDLPVYAREMAVGKMTIVGAADRLPMVEQLFQLTEILAEVPQILPPLARSAPVVTGAPAPGVPANGMVPRTASV